MNKLLCGCRLKPASSENPYRYLRVPGWVSRSAPAGLALARAIGSCAWPQTFGNGATIRWVHRVRKPGYVRQLAENVKSAGVMATCSCRIFSAAHGIMTPAGSASGGTIRSERGEPKMARGGLARAYEGHWGHCQAGLNNTPGNLWYYV